MSEIFEEFFNINQALKSEVAEQLKRAIERHELQLHYQPIISMETGEIEELEALVRWLHPQNGLILPTQFIPLAETTGLIIPLGVWVLEAACQQLRLWQVQKLISSKIAVSVNISSQQLISLDFVTHLDRILSETGLDARCLKLELTETANMLLNQETEFLLQELRFRHIDLSLDDFGTGYSSLVHLHRIPAKCLKIDRSFVQCLDVDWKSRAIVNSIVSLANSLGMTVTAEGIETEEHLLQIQQLGCQYGQGYWFSQPLNSEKMAQLLLNKLNAA